jgi:hypothetical protein
MQMNLDIAKVEFVLDLHSYGLQTHQQGPQGAGTVAPRARLTVRQCPDSFACIFTFFFFFTHDKVFGNCCNNMASAKLKLRLGLGIVSII